MSRSTKGLPALLLAGALVLAGCSGSDETVGDPDALGTPPSSPQPTTRTASPRADEPSEPSVRRPTVVRTVASGLRVPWGIAFLPDGTALVSERDTARILALEGPRNSRVREIGTVEDISLGFTMLRTDDGRQIIIANGTMAQQTIIKLEAGPGGDTAAGAPEAPERR